VVDFLPQLCDAELREAYAGAEAVIAPSHIEGFSLPIVEAIANGAPVIASDCKAQKELISNPEALFPSDNPAVLGDRLERLLRSPEFREALRREQAGVADRFREEAVAERLWRPLRARFADFSRTLAPSILRRLKPAVAFVTPYPPERTGIAPYTAQTVAAASEYFRLDLFTNAPRPTLNPAGLRDRGMIGPRPYVDRTYDAVVSVLGNSDFHSPIFREYERHGGTCILHDSRLTGIYHHRLGRVGFARMAERILGRGVSHAEIESWLRDEESPTQFVEDVVARATPLLVHTERFRQIIKERHGIEAHALPFCPNMHFSDEEYSPASREDARRHLGLSSEAFVISSFGFVDLVRKGILHCVMAVSLLRSWGVPAELHLVGRLWSGDQPALDALSKQFDVAKWVHVFDRFVDDCTYKRYLLGSDAAVQLRSYGWGQASAALADAISAGLPCVSDEGLAEACGAPAYVRVVPRAFSHLLIAEALLDIFEAGRERLWEEERREYLAVHNFRSYAARLSETLGLS
jgi:glycosyltransferase involved in cell wall biosynthesis